MTLPSKSRLAAALLFAALVFHSALPDLGADETKASHVELVAAAAYEQKCVRCHGEHGQGVIDHYEEPLIGDLSVEELAQVIEQSMPEEDPESCVGNEARQIAAFIFNKFYSPAAQQRQGISSAPRVELARLTVPQYRNAVADLIGHFTPQPKVRGKDDAEDDKAESNEGDATHGLAGEYFQSKGMSKADELGFERVDHRIDFDFGEESPGADISSDQFAVVWQGSLIADDTGYYEFRLRTQNGARMYLNESK